jgi:hypothetical protein
VSFLESLRFEERENQVEKQEKRRDSGYQIVHKLQLFTRFGQIPAGGKKCQTHGDVDEIGHTILRYSQIHKEVIKTR